MEFAAIALAVILYGIFSHDSSDRVVLLPEPDGKVGKVVVKAAGGERLLDQPYAAADVSGRGAIAARSADAAEVRNRYGSTLAAQPRRPASYTVYFVSGSDELTSESKPVLEQVKQEAAGRPAAEVTAIGHTDRVGRLEDNDALSKMRAEVVRGALQEAGIPAAQIESAGRGEREPMVATADEVAEPKNRRVEINIR
jgi:outer membrane protein OmpA-like peptidoglycan-associated protein